jgi:histidyl-tRNA synthetase
MKVNRCKGMKDLPPAEMAVFRQVENICCDCCSRWGYREVRTPTIEYLHLFTSAGTLTPGMLGKVYSFLDWDGWSGERVVLRPDGTIPVARLYTESCREKELARLFYSTEIFRFEETGEKPRERWQCGAELIGAGSTMADAELILLSLDILEKIGLKKVELRLSHAGLIKSLLDKLGISHEERDHLFDRILDGDIEALSQVKREFPELENALLPLLSLKGKSPGFIRNQRALLIKDVPEVGPHLDDFLRTVAVLDDLGCRYTIDIASGASFEYYTGMVFQIYIGGEKIGGGGRYDALIPAMGGGDVPASGLALYLDRLVKLVNPEELSTRSVPKVVVRALAGSAGNVKELFKLAGGLRDKGYITEISLNGDVSAGSRWVVDITDKPGQMTVTDLTLDKRYEVSTIDEAVKLLEGKGGSQAGLA